MKKIALFVLLITLASCWNNNETPTTNVSENKDQTVEKKSDEKEMNQKIILALWDSLTAWYNLDIKDSFPSQIELLLKQGNYNYKVQNAWVSWDTSKNLLDRISLYDDIDVEIYLLGIWWNDWLRLWDTELMKANIEKIIDHIQNVNPDWIIVLEWMQMPLNVWIEYATNFQNVFTDIKNEREEISFYNFLLEWVATKKELNLNDWVHPNEKWYTIIANNIYNFLQKENLITK